jgi:acetyl esterase/lipase
MSWQARATNTALRILARPRTRLRSEADIAAFRGLADRLDARLGRLPSDVRVRWDESGPVRGQWIEVPESRTDRLLLYLHGGGFVARTPKLHASLVARLCRTARMRAFVPDYRLAPEHPFPAAPQDGLASYEWLLLQGVDAANIALGGDSAGGCLALATLLQARDRGLPSAACGVLLSPATNLAEAGDSYRRNAHRDALASDWQSMAVLAHAYLREADPRAPLASPLYGRLGDLPPLLCQVGGTELLLDDSRSLVERAKAAGGDASVEVWDGMPHVFQAFRFLPESRRALEQIARFLDHRFGEPA